ncbi:MAG: hypothetical protein JXR68_06955 [Bacteroidales bacterium]|nr:hypothetical protein [Bacteroidales bacterium]
MKKIFLVIAGIVFSLSLFAQSFDATHKIGIGVGSSFLGLNTNMWVKGVLVKDAYASPVPQLSYTFMADENIGVGFAATYQFFYFDLFPIDAQSSAVIMKINRFNATFHLKYYFINNNKLDVYAGGRLGITYWQGNVSFSQLNDYISRIAPAFISDALISKVVPSNLIFRKPFFAYQLNLGGNVYVTKNIGLKIETGLGAPYWAMTGLNLRL